MMTTTMDVKALCSAFLLLSLLSGGVSILNHGRNIDGSYCDISEDHTMCKFQVRFSFTVLFYHCFNVLYDCIL